ncbi:MAG: DUF167 family protein [Rheinheimera sp.]|nr:DUF167 family protein [Rheinheimera sp.]
MTAALFTGTDLRLKLYIQPNARCDDWIGLHGGEIKVAITAPPIDGKANLHLQRFVARSFNVAKSAVVLEKGELGRHKTLLVRAPQQLPDVVKNLLLAD